MTPRDIRYQGAVVDGTRLLLLRCRTHAGHEFWLLPGGGREEGEDGAACVAREVREEAGLDVTVERLLYEVPAEPPDGTYRLWRTYLCRLRGGEAAPGGGDSWASIIAVRWLALAQTDSWEADLHDVFLHPQLLRIRNALGIGGAHE